MVLKQHTLCYKNWLLEYTGNCIDVYDHVRLIQVTLNHQTIKSRHVDSEGWFWRLPCYCSSNCLCAKERLIRTITYMPAAAFSHITETKCFQKLSLFPVPLFLLKFYLGSLFHKIVFSVSKHCQYENGQQKHNENCCHVNGQLNVTFSNQSTS